jgi:hypothetical protein
MADSRDSNDILLEEGDEGVIDLNDRARKFWTKPVVKDMGKPPRFRLVAFDDVLMSTTSFYLVKGLIPREGLVIVWGAPKCGKSFWTFDLLMHVACGWDYRGVRVKGGSVVYGRPFPSYKMKLREASPSLRTPSASSSARATRLRRTTTRERRNGEGRVATRSGR